MNGPRWIKQWIADLALLNEQFRNDDGSVDFEALGREEYMFRTALITQRLEKSERARDTYMKAKAAYDASSENGKKGGRPRKDSGKTYDQVPDALLDSKTPSRGGSAANISGTPEALVNQRRAGADSVRGTPSHRAPARPRAPFRNKEDFMAWAIDDGLDPVDANECWEATEERGGKDADGNTVKNMKAFARQWCRTRKDNRRTA